MCLIPARVHLMHASDAQEYLIHAIAARVNLMHASVRKVI